jgi:uncharacterized membrane protein (UPF0127 family)
MKIQKIGLGYKGKKINLELKVCNMFERFSGLMFTRKEKAKALLFDFKKPVRIALHSFFVFFPFIVVWINPEGKIIDIKKISPFKPYILPEKEFSKIIEIPVNKKYFEVTNILVGD